MCLAPQKKTAACATSPAHGVNSPSLHWDGAKQSSHHSYRLRRQTIRNALHLRFTHQCTWALQLTTAHLAFLALNRGLITNGWIFLFVSPVTSSTDVPTRGCLAVNELLCLRLAHRKLQEYKESTCKEINMAVIFILKLLMMASQFW